MSAMTLVQTNGSAKGMQSASWLKQSVQQFFQAVNWDGRALAPPPTDDTTLTPAAPVSTALSLTMKVSDYFDAIPWDGIPVIAAPIFLDSPEESAPTPQDNVTLDDFFSSF